MAKENHAKEEKRIELYSNRHNILLVGEGDFSFAACLATAFGDASNMIATSLDTEGELAVKHPTAAANLELLRNSGCTIIYGVDASTMAQHLQLRHREFHRIVFNFPHAGFGGREHQLHQIQLHQDVVRGFLRNVATMLDTGEGGEVHVTHKTSYPFTEWNIVELGKEAGLKLIDEVEFYRWLYPGYVNKRGGNRWASRSNTTFPVGSCSTFKFGSAAEDSLMSELLEFKKVIIS